MTELQRDRLTAVVLLAVAVIWIAGVYWTVPPAPGETQIGPRGFPLAMGYLLALLAVLMLVSGFVSSASAPDRRPTAESHREAVRAEHWAVIATFGFVLVYVLALDLIGFVFATIVAVAAFLWFMLRVRSPWLLLGLPLGLGFGIWFIMNQLMGVYLPHGSLISVF